MSASTYIAWTSAMGTTAAPTTISTGTSTSASKTLLQIRTGTAQKIRLIGWGYTFDNAPANNVRMELCETGSIYGTVTAHVAAGVMPYADSGAPASGVQLGTTHTGYNASAEGSIVSVRTFDFQYENGLYYKYRFELGREPEIGPDKAIRIRSLVTSASAVNVSAFLIWEE